MSMSDNIPFDIQIEIIKKVSNVKSSIRFRLVSKSWKSFIDSSEFIKGYGARNTQPHSHILMNKGDYTNQYICLVDDDKDSFKVQQQEFAPFVMSPLHKQYYITFLVGACHGLLCLYGHHRRYNEWMLVIWNPSIGKSFGIVVPGNYDTKSRTDYGFGVYPVTSDPTVVKVLRGVNMPWHVEVFTLSSGVWNVIPSGTLPRQSIKFNSLTHVVIDRFMYWGAWEKAFTDNGESTINHMVVSFDFVTKKFKVVDLPDSLTNEIIEHVSVCKLGESLVLYECIKVEGARGCGVWVVEHDSSFRKLFTIDAQVDKILGFNRNGETIFITQKDFGWTTTIDVYNPCSQQIKNLICGRWGSFFMDSYKESLLLLDHLNSHVYYDDNLSK